MLACAGRSPLCFYEEVETTIKDDARKEVRTPLGMLIGIYCEGTSMLYIKDGTKLRIIKVPCDGLEIITINGNNTPENTFIAPETKIL